MVCETERKRELSYIDPKDGMFLLAITFFNLH
jgi:hypothetical protein